MSFLSPFFENDIFISYAHVDNDPLAGQVGWVSHFHENLEKILARRLGRRENISIWRDEQLPGNKEINKGIPEALMKSGLIVCIMSPGYVTSSSCLEELKGFCANSKHHLGHYEAGKARLFKVSLMEVLRENEHQSLQNVNGYRFYDPKPKPGFTREYRATKEDSRYWIELDKLSHDIANLLRGMKDGLDNNDSGGAANRSISVSKKDKNSKKWIKTVYLSQVTDDLDFYRRVLRKEFEERNIRVLPEPQSPLPNNKDEMTKKIKGYLDESDFSINMFSEIPGKAVIGDGQLIGHLQYSLTKDFISKNQDLDNFKFHQFIWTPNNLKMENVYDKKHREFLETFPLSLAENNVDFVESGFEYFKETITKKILPPQKPAVNRRPLVYITGQQEDLDSSYARSMIECCRGSYHDIFTSTDSENNHDRDDQYMELADGLIILYGKSPKDWVVMKALQARNKLERKSQKPLLAAVFDGPPPNKEDLGLHIDSVIILNGRHGFKKQEFQDFLGQLKNRVFSLNPSTNVN